MLGQAVGRLWNDIRRTWAGWVAAGSYLVTMMWLFGAVCPMVLLTGVPCPACGMTRAGVLLLTGQWSAAYAMHPMIFGVALLLVAAVVMRYWLGQSVQILLIPAVFLCVLTLLLYGLRMVVDYPIIKPMEHFDGNLLAWLQRMRR